MYIPAAPMCEKNLAYARKVKAALETGASPDDFPREDYETTGRAFHAARSEYSRQAGIRYGRLTVVQPCPLNCGVPFVWAHPSYQIYAPGYVGPVSTAPPGVSV